MFVFNVGDRVVYHGWTMENGREVPEAIFGEVISTFYEDGDPVQGLAIRTEEGRVIGSLCASRCEPV